MTDLAVLIEQALMARPGSRRRGDELDFLCVAHEERNASASWNRKKDTWNCLQCGAHGPGTDLAERLGIHVETPKERAEKGTIVATYPYHDADGNLLYEKVRYSPKRFALRRRDGAGWSWNLNGVSPVLYRLPEVLSSTGRVYVVEGEKDADSLRERGLTATCNRDGAQAKGSSKWFPRLYNPPLEGRDVVILPDADTAGRNHAAAVALSLRGTARSVRVLELPGLGEKEDVSDWLLGGGTVEELAALADACPEWSEPKEPEGLTAFKTSDAGQAELFAHLFGDRVRYDWSRNRWLVWDRHRWVPDNDGELYRLAIEAARARGKAAYDLPIGQARTEHEKAAYAFESAGKVKSMLELARSVPPIKDAGLGWDANPLAIGNANGVVNLATGELRDGRREDRITMTTGLVFDPDATCPTWTRFLEDVFPDEHMRGFIQRMAGYVLTGETREQAWFLCHGSGANGKSTFIDALSLALGEYAGDTPADTLCSKGSFGGGAASPDVAALANKRLVTCNETEELGRLNAGKVKHLTGGSPVTARPLYGHPFTYIPSAKIVLTTNHLPRVDDDSDGFWRRVRLIPFTRRFSIEERDDRLMEKLKGELPGILAWAVRGAVAWHKERLNPPVDVLMATMNYREASDPLAEFIADCCEVGEGCRATRAELYGVYKAWCERQGYRDKDVWGVRYFGEKIGGRWPSRPSHGQRYYMGIGLRAKANVTQGDAKTGPFEPTGDVTGYVPGLSEAQTQGSSRVPESTSPTSPTSPAVEIGPCYCASLCVGGECDYEDMPWWEDDEGGRHCQTHHPAPEMLLENGI